MLLASDSNSFVRLENVSGNRQHYKFFMRVRSAAYGRMFMCQCLDTQCLVVQAMWGSVHALVLGYAWLQLGSYERPLVSCFLLFGRRTSPTSCIALLPMAKYNLDCARHGAQIARVQFKAPEQPDGNMAGLA